jgi:hypothetical protein
MLSERIFTLTAVCGSILSVQPFFVTLASRACGRLRDDQTGCEQSTSFLYNPESENTLGAKVRTTKCTSMEIPLQGSQSSRDRKAPGIAKLQGSQNRIAKSGKQRGPALPGRRGWIIETGPHYFKQSLRGSPYRIPGGLKFYAIENGESGSANL